jgi:hypothetical protein
MEPDPQNSAPRRVEAYLDQVLAPLTRHLSAFHQQELRRELRTHLSERVSAYQELGMTEDDAVTEALRQFGGAEDFLRQWQQEWRETPSSLTLHDIYKAGKRALIPSLKGILGVNLFCFAVQEGLWHSVNTPINGILLRHSDAVGWAMVVPAFLLLPLWVGAKHGQRIQERAGLGMLAALTAEIAVTSLLYGTVALNTNDGASTGTINMLFNLSLVLLAVWMPVAGGAAAISGWVARKRRGALA